MSFFTAKTETMASNAPAAQTGDRSFLELKFILYACSPNTFSSLYFGDIA